MAGWLTFLVQATDPVGPGGWSARNWLGLLCQVVVFILLVAFIFYLAGLGEDEDGDPGGEAAPAPPVEAGADAAPPEAPGDPPAQAADTGAPEPGA